ncbi:unnamed protein product [Bursaphelenchus okinawaensis]|uniref:G_PROTEIN_RECEP_F1_2 domain-containing protein n=1 Tax=Bursaphelenchus okinawaensis TaxID=465554 RepID=A0A811L0T8_9BILA|nr:unnamed protein product [Bursaphelenchus okinawaensis]CAG9114700.1 unnamed protein product [Bursaphelenchus okinawaensis]
MYCEYWLLFENVCYAITSVIGPFLSALLLYVIYCTRKNVLKNYQAIIVLYCIHDIFYEVFCIASHWTTNIKSGLLIMGVALGKDEPYYVVFFIGMYSYTMYMLMFMLVVSCHCRYKLVSDPNNGGRQWVFSYVLATCMSVGLAAGTSYLLNKEKMLLPLNERQELCFDDRISSFIQIDTVRVVINLVIDYMYKK